LAQVYIRECPARVSNNQIASDATYSSSRSAYFPTANVRLEGRGSLPNNNTNCQESRTVRNTALPKALQQFYTAKVAAKPVLVRAMPAADCANAHSTRFWVYPV